MRTASILIQTIAFTALFAVYAQGYFEGSGVRRALQTIGATVSAPVTTPGFIEQG
ncbi:MAG: hypothetical protein WDZ83_04515 [Rhizobiaceae bacterium]